MNQNHNTKLLKKIEIGNPLYNLGLFALLEQYNKCQTDEDLINFYHKFLDCIDSGSNYSKVAIGVAYAMIAFSTGMDVNPLFLEMEMMILKHNNSYNI